MASRQGAHVSHRIPRDGGESPNHFIDHITIDLRVFWPPFTVDKLDVVEQLMAAVSELVQKIQDVDLQRPKIWLVPPE